MTGVAIHAVVYVAVNALLIAVWVLFGKGSMGEIPGYLVHLDQARDAQFWPVYPIVFWGVGLLIHAGVVAATTPARLRAAREKRRQQRARERLQASVVGVLDGTPLADAAVAGIRFVDGDRAAARARRGAAKKTKGRTPRARMKVPKAKSPLEAAGSAGRATVRAARRARGDMREGRDGLDEHEEPRRGRASAADERAADGGAAPRRFGRRASDRVSARHWVAVLFTDIVDSTPLNQRLGDDEWADLLAAHRTLVRAVVAEHQGLEVGTQGDGFLVRFDVPDDAADCAVSLQRALAEDRAETPHDLHIRIGIHAGEVVQNDDDLVGRVINLASRVTDVAAADEILVTEPLADHLTGDRPIVDRGLRALKGFDQPRHLLALAWQDPGDTIELDAAPPGSGTTADQPAD